MEENGEWGLRLIDIYTFLCVFLFYKYRLVVRAMYDIKMDILEMMEISKTSVLYSSSDFTQCNFKICALLWSWHFCSNFNFTCTTDCKAMPCHKMQLYVWECPALAAWRLIAKSPRNLSFSASQSFSSLEFPRFPPPSSTAIWPVHTPAAVRRPSPLTPDLLTLHTWNNSHSIYQAI